MKAYRYKLTSSNRHLADFFKGVVVDEENSMLWSDQNLSYFCGEFWEPNKFQIVCIGIPMVIVFWSWMGLLAVCKLFLRTNKLVCDTERRINIAIMSRFYY